jgi:hypothetical protein
MDLPVEFPSETEVILEDVARFRALSPEERMRSLFGMVDFGARLKRMSPKSAWIAEQAEAQERLARENIGEFIARHGF